MRGFTVGIVVTSELIIDGLQRNKCTGIVRAVDPEYMHVTVSKEFYRSLLRGGQIWVNDYAFWIASFTKERGQSGKIEYGLILQNHEWRHPSVV